MNSIEEKNPMEMFTFEFCCYHPSGFAYSSYLGKTWNLSVLALYLEISWCLAVAQNQYENHCFCWHFYSIFKLFERIWLFIESVLCIFIFKRRVFKDFFKCFQISVKDSNLFNASEFEASYSIVKMTLQ